jgi:hypothetical protein
MRRKLRARDGSVALCYALATVSPAIAYIGLATFTIFMAGSVFGEATLIAKPLHVGFQLLQLPLFLYWVASAAAFGEIGFGRMLVGTFLALGLALILIVLAGVLFTLLLL